MTTAKYIFDTSGEAARLQIQAEVWGNEVEAMLDAVGLEPGASCVEIACGSAGILEPLSKRVGPRGRVVAVDTTPHILEAARAYCLARDLGNVEFVHADAGRTPLPRGSFDFVHSRFLLLLGPRYKEFLSEMIELARPGGVVCCEESDQDSWNYFPTPPSWPDAKLLIERAFKALDGDPNFARRLVPLLRGAGLEDVRVRAAVNALQDSHPYMQMPLIVLHGMRETILKHQLATESQLAGYIADMETAVADPDTWETTFTVAQVWGRRPQDLRMDGPDGVSARLASLNG
ncbi:MAG TPA: methyltransferase domain-containing protein [Streptosporangiaceae bacterium]|nr:methyltransferase domain-containing protein [Streptosporangiaceae bacterium]